MAVTEPDVKSKYPREKWLLEPCKPEPRVDYEKHFYRPGDTFETIARGMSMPWRPLNAGGLMALNYGTGVQPEVNWYVRNHNAGGADRAEVDGVIPLDAKTDPNPFVWVPRPVPNWNGAYRSRGEQDVGHVAPDDKRGEHMNTLVVPPVYTIGLELGDLDAMFDSTPSGAPSPIGRAQRLQALGYLYTPLGHQRLFNSPDPKNPGKTLPGAYERVWKYYRDIVHKDKKPPGRDLTDREMDAILQQETRSNIIGLLPGAATRLSRGEFLTPRLPRAGEFAMIRFPGGYCYNDRIHRFDDRDDASYRYKLSADRHTLEEAVFKDNPLMGKIPLAATVHKIDENGERRPAEGVTVYFQLVPPDDWPEDVAAAAAKAAANERATQAALKLAANTDPSKTEELTRARLDAENAAAAANAAPPPAPSHPLRAPHLLNEAMDYDKNWKPTITRPGGLTENQWNFVKSKAEAAINQPKANRDAWINDVSNVSAGWGPWVSAAITPEDDGPFVKSDAGPKKYVDDLIAANPAADPEDPLKDNCDKKFGGKRGIKVEGEGGTPGVFEVDVTRDGLHTRRSPVHADYGDMTAARSVAPVDDTDSAGKAFKRHGWAVKAKTNARGHACVVFMPSTVGGDRYRIRAYVGPETLEFDGREPKGPVVTTGTMVVWRSIRLSRYIRPPIPPKASVSAAVREIFSFSNAHYTPPGNANTLDKIWNSRGLDSGLGDVDFSADGLAHAAHGRNNRIKSDGSFDKNYRPMNVQMIGPALQFRRCYCEFIVDTDQLPEAPSSAELQAAFDAGMDAVIAGGDVAKDVDWPKLMFYDPTSPFLINVRRHEHYNALKAADPGSSARPDLELADMGNVSRAIKNRLLDGMMKHLAGGGVLPGLTLVYTARGTTWDHIYPGDASVTTSGVGLPMRGCFLWYTARSYSAATFPYNTTANALHEMGHVLVRQHQRPVPDNGDADTHENQDVCTCVMSYKGCHGQYCGRCSLSLRGYRTKSSSFPAGA